MISPRYLCPLLLLAAALLPAGGTAAAGGLYELVDARLELMDEVAAYKWRAGLPVEDADREALVLDRAVEDALAHGFTPASSRAFFTAQIEAAKQIQRYWFRQWAADGPPGGTVDLDNVIRPELLRLGGEILTAADALAGRTTLQPVSDRGVFDAVVQVAGLDDEARTAVFEALSALEQFPSRLDQVLATGVLRIGTTGDYAPFSHGAGSAPEGIDVDLGRRLAEALGARAEFVATSWPTLLADLSAGRYDIAMSGVSRTVERATVGYLSSGYYAGGKAAIARCGEAARFSTLDAVDRPGVRVIVNPGGTNERFVDANVHRARKVLHADNRTIFDALVDGRGDVMITDRIEVELQAARHPELCATLTRPLTYQEKAFLMPRDEPLRQAVETWLSLARADGTVAAVFRDHGIAPRLPERIR